MPPSKAAPEGALASVIDAHVHVLDPLSFPYPSDITGYRPMPSESGSTEDLVAVFEHHCVAGAVLVQPSTYGEDNGALLDALGRYPERLRGVAVVAAKRRAIESIAQIPGMVGLRLNAIQSLGDRLDAALLELTLDAAGDCGLITELVAPAAQLAALAPQLIRAKGPVLIDHMAMPDLAQGADGESFRAVLGLSAVPQIFIKLSAPFRQTADGLGWDRLTPYCRALLEAFGPDRCLWGSDWPFINLEGRAKPSYADLLAWIAQQLGDLRDKVLHGTAAHLFRFPQAMSGR